MAKITIYGLPGWGFDSDIMSLMSSNTCRVYPLNYIDAAGLEDATEMIAKQLPVDSILMGWSFGGLVAINLAIKYAHKVKKLILLNSQPKFIASDDWVGMTHHTAEKFIYYFKDHEAQAWGHFTRLANAGNGAGYDLVLNHYKHNEQFSTSLSQLRSFLLADLRCGFSSINMPILQIIGSRDAILNQDEGQLAALNSNMSIQTFYRHGHSGFVKHQKSYQQLLSMFAND